MSERKDHIELDWIRFELRCRQESTNSPNTQSESARPTGY